MGRESFCSVAARTARLVPGYLKAQHSVQEQGSKRATAPLLSQGHEYISNAMLQGGE